MQNQVLDLDPLLSKGIFLFVCLTAGNTPLKISSYTASTGRHLNTLILQTVGKRHPFQQMCNGSGVDLHKNAYASRLVSGLIKTCRHLLPSCSAVSAFLDISGLIENALFSSV